MEITFEKRSKKEKTKKKQQNMQRHDWQLLPEEICIHILTKLDYVDRFNAASICNRWFKSLSAKNLWRDVTVQFKENRDARLVLLAKHYGQYFQNLHIKCYQRTKKNQENACNFLDMLLHQNRSLTITNFKIEFCEENPLFYSGNSFLTVLKRFFSYPFYNKNNKNDNNAIKTIDLSQFPVAFDDDLLDTITQNHACSIETLDIQNKILAARISAEAVANFVSKATQLNSLRIPYSCFGGIDALKKVPESTSLKFLSLTFKRADKFFRYLNGDDWNRIRNAIPDLRIELHFDPTYPLQSTFRIMLPEVPVSSLKLYIQATVNEHINLASMMYKETLCMLEVTSQPNAELDDAVLRVVKECERLESIHVKCGMSKSTVNEILKLKNFQNYTLLSRDE